MLSGSILEDLQSADVMFADCLSIGLLRHRWCVVCTSPSRRGLLSLKLPTASVPMSGIGSALNCGMNCSLARPSRTIGAFCLHGDRRLLQLSVSGLV